MKDKWIYSYRYYDAEEVDKVVRNVEAHAFFAGGVWAVLCIMFIVAMLKAIL